MGKSKQRRNSTRLIKAQRPPKSEQTCAPADVEPSASRHGIGVRLILCCSLVLITFLVFGRWIRYDFLNYDDSYYVYQNSLISKGLTRAGLLSAFTKPLVGN